MNKFLHILCTTALLGTGLFLSGCGGDSASLREQIEEQDRHIQELETALNETRDSHAEEIDTLRAELTEGHQRELDDLGSTLRRQVNEHSRTIAGLRVQLAKTEPSAVPSPTIPAETAPPAPVVTAPSISVYTPPTPDLSDFINPPASPAGDLFPVQIESVKGSRVVVGSHTTTRLVETGEVLKDDFGDDKPVLKPETIEVDDYDHEVTFVAENLTRKPVTLRFRAGRGWKSLTLASGDQVDCKVASVVGASLFVKVGTETRTYPVIYL